MEELIKEIEYIKSNIDNKDITANLICNKIRMYRLKMRINYTSFECMTLIDITNRYVDYDSLKNALIGNLNIYELKRFYNNIDILNNEEIKILNDNIIYNTDKMIRIITLYLYGNLRINEDEYHIYLDEFNDLIKYKYKLNIPVDNMEVSLLEEFYNKYKENYNTRQFI